MPMLSTIRRTTPVLLIAIVVGALAGCGGGGDGESDQGEPAVPERVKLDSGLEFEDLVVGTGESPTAGQTAVVHYTGWLTDGTKFDSSHDRNKPFEFAVGRRRVIKGWDQGVVTMKVGGKRKLYIPPALGYGERGFGNVIPPNSDLVFEVELLEIKP
jgi:FKBP-type peptidyl-prolyl cis-trans isomerase